MSKYRKRAQELVAQMTLEEKVSQTLYNAPAIERLGIPAYNWWNEALHGVARPGRARQPYSPRQSAWPLLLTKTWRGPWRK